MKIVITGGHITPALAFIEHIKANTPKDEVFLLGRTYSQSNKKQIAIEKQLAQELVVPFIPIEVPKFVSFLPWHTSVYVFAYFQAVLQTMRYLLRIRPSVVVSFGGYYAVPIVLVAWFLRIPIVTHEQTATAGRANRFISFFATKVAISFPNSTRFFPAQKTVFTGNPIRADLLHHKPKQPEWFSNSGKKPVLYITGGNQGSHIINTVTKNILRHLTRDFVVIHACGRPTTTANYFQELSQLTRTLPPTHQNRYFVREWITSQELGWILRNAQLCVSRAGANTVQELIQTQLPALLIPLPFSYHNEQTLNAKIMTEVGGAISLSQKDFTPEIALQTIKNMMAKHKSYKRKLETIVVPADASKKLYQVVCSTSKNKK